MALLGGCAGLDRALAPAPRPWPVSTDGRIRRDGRMLRVYGTSMKSREDAEADARKTLERWLLGLDMEAELLDRRALVRSVLDSPRARPIPSPIHQAAGHAALIELDLVLLQKQLGTHYDLPPPGR